MLNQKEAPEVYIMSPDRRQCYGVVKDYTEFSEDIRFGTCSEININVPKKHYSIEKGCWIDNPYYNKLVKGNLLYLTDDTPYFLYDYTKPYADDNNGYSISSSQITNRGKNTTTFDINTGLKNFKVQKEVLLFDVGSRDGYYWQGFSEIVNGKFKSFPHYWSTKFYTIACAEFFPIKPYDIIAMNNRGNNGMGNWYTATDENSDIGIDVDYQYLYVHFYTDADATTYVGSINMGYNIGNPIYRTSINNLPASYSTIKEKLKDGGYVRFSLICNRHRPNPNSDWNTNYNSWYKTTTRMENNETVTIPSYEYHYPDYGYVRIYSGERRCIDINTSISGSAYNLFMRWFVIDSVQEDKEGMVDIKSIKAYSYEYTLKNRTISLPDETIALYIPKKIIDIVNSNNWVIDKVERKDSNNNIVTNTDTAPQYMLTGLLNRILEVLPHWRIGHISSELQARYRAFSNIDNTSIYNFLMNDVQQAYQCYFVFDNDSLTISAYTQRQVNTTSNNIYLTWENAIRRMTLTNEKSEKITALRVHTAEDNYGLGLVNPYGSSTIYNFSAYLDQMNFVADNSDNDPWGRNEIIENGVTRNRTLKEAVEVMQNLANFKNNSIVIPTCIHCGALLGAENHGHYCNVCGNDIYNGTNPDYIQNIIISSLNDYKNYAIKFIEANMEYIKMTTKEQELLTEYRIIADKINVYLQEDHPESYESFMLSDVPVEPLNLPTDFTENQYKFYYHSTGFFTELKNASKNYYDIYYQVHDNYKSGDLTVKYKKELYYNILCKVAQKLNLNYAKQVENINIRNTELDNDIAEINSAVIPSVLTPAEILALQPFIVEGDWTNQNAVFSETYSADDIIKTLDEIKVQASDELESFYSKDNYEFEINLINWLALTEFKKQLKLLRVGRPICNINTEDNKWIRPHLLELHLNYTNKDDFKMTFNTDYNQKTILYRFADLYNSINQISLSDNTFTFNE